MDGANSLEDLLVKLGLENYKTTKLTLTNLLSIGFETCKKIEARPLKNVPWYFLQKLMALNGTARNIEPQDIETEDDYEDEDLDFNSIHESIDVSNSVNPLDVVCALLHCSDHLLQRQILLNMSMCQFAVPLLVPSGDGSDCTLLLWAMKDIVKRWRPQSIIENKGSVEDNVVNISMPIFSFVRVGKYSLSKSNILNQVLGAEGEHHDFFVHKNMIGGNIKRLISNGLVEISWYFPAGSDSDLFPDPVAITNLRGDLLHHRKQVRFLTEISAMVFIFVENLNEVDKNLSEFDISSNKLFFIINITSNDITGKHNTFLEKLSLVGHNNYSFTISKTDYNGKQILQYLKKIFLSQIMKKRIKIWNHTTSQDGKISKFLQTQMKNIMAQEERYSNLDNSARVASGIGIAVDENSEECVKTKLLAQKITKDIIDVRDYKKTNMKLQGDLWSQISRNEKEMCRMRGQGGRSGEEYRSHLIKENQDLRRKQYEEKIPDNIRTFREALVNLSKVEKQYFLNWISFYLDSKWKKKLPSESTSLGHILPESKLGIEHFLRELVQLYEAECSMVKNKDIKETKKKFNNLPGIAADLLLDGFPLELIDGDVSNIPLQWITDVLTELDKKTGGQCRMRVITVLGVQSTGKSTLLNTMFGLQFPVASGRCTRGAFMTLINVQKNFQKELGCEFILVIDTEGLKAPELALIDDSYEHDNELASFIVLLSDITLVNMGTENTTDMKDILQIVVHAFLRMKEVGKKNNCQFVYQNVADVSAHDKNMRRKKIFLDHLDEITKVSAKMESNSDVTTFSEIIDFDLEKHIWYIPSLWHGVPPMASVTQSYSKTIHGLKIYLLEFLKQKTNSYCCNITDIKERIKSLWDAVKHEKFLFSFRSSLVADAYNKLCIMNSNLEWQFRKAAHSWMMETENQIKNQLSNQNESDIMTNLSKNIQKVLDAEAKKMEDSLEKYFEDGYNNVRLVEICKWQFMESVPLLKRELQFYLNNKCQKVIETEKEKNKIRKIQRNYQKITEEQVSELLKKQKGDRSKLSIKEMESEFEALWKETLQMFKLTLERKNIGQMMLEHLQKDMKNKPGYINKKLINLKNLEKYQDKIFKMKIKYLEGTHFTVIKKRCFPEFWDEATGIADTILDRCDRYIFNKVTTKQDYHETYCQQLLDIINEALSDKSVEKYEFKPLFELKIKLLALGKAAPLFQKMHEDFINENDPKRRFEALKSYYLKTFKQDWYKIAKEQALQSQTATKWDCIKKEHKDTSDLRKQMVSNEKYRVEVQSKFHCQKTGIKFEVESKTIIEYSLEYGEEYMKLIQEKGYELLGPIFNVEVLSGRLSAVYLPHYVCLEGFGGGQAKIKCGHFKDGKVTFTTPTRIEASHVILDNPTFSCIAPVGEYFTSFLRREKFYPFNGKVLIYFRVVCVEDEDSMEYRVHLYVIPADKPHLEKLNDLKRPNGFKRVDKPNLTSNVYTNTTYIISGEPEPKINPKTLQFMVHKEIEDLPFTEINFPKETEKISLRVEAENGSGPVWIGELTRDIKELSRQAVQRGVPSEHFILRNRSALIQKVKTINPVLDDLISQKLLTEEEYNTVRSQAISQDQMRELFKYVVNWGREDIDTFYQFLKVHNKSCIEEIEKSN